MAGKIKNPETISSKGLSGILLAWVPLVPWNPRIFEMHEMEP